MDDTRILKQDVLQDPELQAILGDEAATLLGVHPSMLAANRRAAAAAAAAGGGSGAAGAAADGDFAGLESLIAQQQQQDGFLDDISLRHRVSDLEAENARLRNLLQQQTASSSELTRKLNLRDLVVDGLRKTVIQNQSTSARALGQPATLGFEVVDALEEEISNAVAAQVRLRETSEAQLKIKIERTERHLKRIIEAKEREIIQLHLQFRQTLVQLRSQHTGDIQNVFEENKKLRNMAAEAEQTALVAAEVQFNARLRVEQARIENESHKKIEAKEVEMKYLRECLDTQEAAAKALESTINRLNNQITAKERLLHHVLDVELPFEVQKVRKQLNDYIDRESSRGQLDLANAQIQIEDLEAAVDDAKKAAISNIESREKADLKVTALQKETSQKDLTLRENASRITTLQANISALERDADVSNMEVGSMRRQIEQLNEQMNLGASGHSPTAGSPMSDLRRQVSIATEENEHLREDLEKATDQVKKLRDDLHSTAASRAVAQDRISELEELMRQQVEQSRAQLEKAENLLRKALTSSTRTGGGGGAAAGAVVGGDDGHHLKRTGSKGASGFSSAGGGSDDVNAGNLKSTNSFRQTNTSFKKKPVTPTPGSTTTTSRPDSRTEEKSGATSTASKIGGAGGVHSSSGKSTPSSDGHRGRSESSDTRGRSETPPSVYHGVGGDVGPTLLDDPLISVAGGSVSGQGSIFGGAVSSALGGINNTSTLGSGGGAGASGAGDKKNVSFADYASSVTDLRPPSPTTTTTTTGTDPFSGVGTLVADEKEHSSANSRRSSIHAGGGGATTTATETTGTSVAVGVDQSTSPSASLRFQSAGGTTTSVAVGVDQSTSPSASLRFQSSATGHTSVAVGVDQSTSPSASLRFQPQQQTAPPAIAGIDQTTSASASLRLRNTVDIRHVGVQCQRLVAPRSLAASMNASTRSQRPTTAAVVVDVVDEQMTKRMKREFQSLQQAAN